MKLYLIAHVRGADFHHLRTLGFRVFFPAMDDYVFLEDTPLNQKYLGQQAQLGLYFLRKNSTHLRVNQRELDRMAHQTTAKIQPMTVVKVVTGYAENLEGTVISINPETSKAFVRLKGWNREYELELEMIDLVEQKDGLSEAARAYPSQRIGGEPKTD